MNCLAAMAACVMPCVAAAADFCVQNDSQFAAATSAAQLLAGPTWIRLGAGKTFHLANTAFIGTGSTAFSPNGGLAIEGGYNADCSATVTRDAASSVLDGTGAGSGQPWYAIYAGGDFTLSTLTVTHLSRDMEVHAGPDQSRLRWSHVRTVDSACIHILGGEDNDLRVDNSVFARINDGSGTLCEFSLEVQTDHPSDSTQVALINNTITANDHGGVRIHNNGGVTRFYNNIIHGNDSGFVDLDNTDGPLLALDNSVGTHAGSYLAGSTGNSTANPLFVSTTDFNLQAASPARESGFSSPPGGLSAWDIENGARVVGNVVDRGAYEADSSGSPILIVTNTNDSGAGSLRAAITDANANPADNIIGFNISGACPRTIALDSELPPIVGNLSIRGYTQPGSQPNTSGLTDNATICVELVEAAGHTITNGLRFAPTPSSTSQDVSGLAIGNFTTGIRMDGPISGSGVGCSIWGNFIGLAANGTTLRANPFAGIDIEGRMYCTIGGDDDAQRNVVAGGLAGVRINADQTNFVTNNYIGTTHTGGTARPNGIGVALLNGLNYVDDNVISGNSSSAVTMNGAPSAGNTVRNNRIGLVAFRLCGSPPCAPDFLALPNGADAIYISGGGYGNRIVDNTLAFNGGAGVRVLGDGSIVNSINANHIYANDGLGIDIGSVGVDPIDNDATADPASPNGGLNAPFLYQSTGGDHSGSVVGRLNTRDGSYHVELFADQECDASGHGEGRYYLGTYDVVVSGALPGQNGQAEFVAPIQGTQDLTGMAISAVAIDSDFDTSRAGNTSEFSNCVTHQFVDFIFVDGFEDEGEGG
jgi:hypothetical protein